MSLTSHLKNSQSPVSRFMATRFPNTRPIVADAKASLAATHTLRPEAKLDQITYITIGMAIDYRIRYYLEVTQPRFLVAYEGACLSTGIDHLELNELGTPPMYRLTGDLMDEAEYSRLIAKREQPGEWVPVPLAQEFFASLNEVVAEANPVGRRLDKANEKELARFCYVLALFETLYRAGSQIRSALFDAPKECVGGLLDIAPAHAIDDLCQMSWAFFDNHTGLLSKPFVLNPGFHGLGGADADLVVDDCLIDIKAAVSPQTTPYWRFWLCQLLGYALLDQTDRLGIRAVGLYMARQATLLRWPIDELLATLSGGAVTSLEQARREFQDTVLRAPLPSAPRTHQQARAQAKLEREEAVRAARAVAKLTWVDPRKGVPYAVYVERREAARAAKLGISREELVARDEAAAAKSRAAQIAAEAAKLAARSTPEHEESR